MKYLALIFLISGNVFADCKEDFFKNLKAGNTEEAYKLMYTKCTRFYVKDEFGGEENIYQEFQQVSKPFLNKYAECQMYEQSTKSEDHLKLKKCLDMKAVKYYKKRLGDPIKEITDQWTKKYSAAALLKKKSERQTASREKEKKKVEKNIGNNQKRAIYKLANNNKSLVRALEKYCFHLNVQSRMGQKIISLSKQGHDHAVKGLMPAYNEAEINLKNSYAKIEKIKGFSVSKHCEGSNTDMEKVHSFLVQKNK